MPLRFPNPSSDIYKFWNTYKILYLGLEGINIFDHDKMTDILINQGSVTSRGAVGEKAKQRSFTKDRSLDPLYNQAKMYSELFRMLGWLHPGSKRTNSKTTELGYYIAKNNWRYVKPLIKECIIHIVFPNPYVENRGGNSIRPFPFILNLMKECEGIVFRDELILTVLEIMDDRELNILEESKRRIIELRSTNDYNTVNRELVKLAKENKMQTNTLKNYTRWPLGILRTMEWGEQINDREIYNTSIRGYKLTNFGEESVKEIRNRIDIRLEDIKEFSEETKINFILLSHYTMLEQSGFRLDKSDYENIDLMYENCTNLVNHVGIVERKQILFSPYQQAEQEEIIYAEQYYKEKFT